MQIIVCYTNCYLLLLEKRVTDIGYKSVVFLVQLRSDREFDFHQHVIQPSYQPKEIATKIGIAKKKEELARLLPSPSKYKTKIISFIEFSKLQNHDFINNEFTYIRAHKHYRKGIPCVDDIWDNEHCTLFSWDEAHAKF